MKNIFSLTLLLIITQFTFAQGSLNKYAYVVVPDQFTFQKSTDQYKLNSLIKFLFEKQGVKAFFESEKIPQEYLTIDCGGLKMKTSKKSSLLKTKLSFELNDCYNKTVFTSAVGVSNEKEYKKAYHTSMREAFKSFNKLKYKYTPEKTAVIKATKITAAVPVVSKSVMIKEVEAKAVNNKIYTNKANLSLELKESNGSYIGKVHSSPSIEYTKGDLICKLFKTSLPNVFKVQWKDSYGNFINTIGYFSENGALKIDVSNSEGIKVMSFSK